MSVSKIRREEALPCYNIPGSARSLENGGEDDSQKSLIIFWLGSGAEKDRDEPYRKFAIIISFSHQANELGRNRTPNVMK